MNTLTYSNAPLVEIIAEIRWSIKKVNFTNSNVSDVQTIAIDPFFEDFKIGFEKEIKEKGFIYHEPLAPKEIPIELLGGKVTDRHREKAGQYPVYQIGSGIFTINTIPPYSGWEKFKQDIIIGIEAFYKSYPIAEKYLKLEMFQLKYVNLFQKKHLYSEEFLSKHLGIQFNFVDDNIISSDEKSGSIVSCSKNDKSIKIHLNFHSAMNEKNEKALVVSITALKKYENVFLEKKRLLDDIESCHAGTSAFFKDITSDELKNVMNGG